MLARLLERPGSARFWRCRDVSACHRLQGDEAAEAQEEEDETAALFRLAAEQLKEKREEDAMSVEERILKCVPPCDPLLSRLGLHMASRLAWVSYLPGRHSCLHDLMIQRWQRTDKRLVHKYVAWCVQVHDKVV